MECSNCGQNFDTGATCPSCRHDVDPAAQNSPSAEKGARIGTPKPKVLCNSCGFRYNSGKTCPSCGHTNSVSDPEFLARQDKKNYDYRPKVKTWVLVISIIGIVTNLISIIINGLYLAKLRDAYREVFPKLTVFFRVLWDNYTGRLLIVALVSCFLSIFLFVNLLRMKKWAVWVFRTLNTFTFVLQAMELQFGSWQLYFALFWAAIFWFADWSDFE